MKNKNRKLQFVHNQGIKEPDEILMYAHCEKCLAEMPAGTSPRDWARLNVGYTKRGFQIWCVRHDVNVDNIEVYGPDERQEGEPLSLECEGPCKKEK